MLGHEPPRDRTGMEKLLLLPEASLAFWVCSWQSHSDPTVRDLPGLNALQLPPCNSWEFISDSAL